MYHILSTSKVIIGLIVCLSLYFTIDPYKDPLLAISGAMVGVFLLAWGGSFYLFYGWKRIIYHQQTPSLLIHSYKLSLLFGLYCLINIVLLLRHQWTGIGGIAILIGFIVAQALLVPQHHEIHKHA